MTPPVDEPVQVPVTVAPQTPLSYDEDLAQFASSIRRGVGTVFRDDYVGKPGASASNRATMRPPSLPRVSQILDLNTTLLNQPAVSLPPVVTKRPVIPTFTPSIVPPANVPVTMTDANIRAVAQQIRERFEAQHPRSSIPVTRIMQSMLPEGYKIVNTDSTFPQVPTGCADADDPPPRPESLAPRMEEEDENTYNARVDAWSRVHNIYLQQMKGYKLRMRTRAMVRSQISGSEKNIRKISDCTKDTPIADWLRQTRLNLIARNVHDEPEQVKQSSSYLCSTLQRRWIIARDKALLEGKPITWRLFSNHLLTGVDGIQPAEIALRALQNFSVQSGKTASHNLYQFQKTLDTCCDCIPGTRFQMPSGFELCTLFIDRVVKYLPKDISNSLIDSHVAKVTAQEEADFFMNNKDAIDAWYHEQTQSLLLQGIAKANALPKEPAGASGSGSDRHHPPKKNGGTKGPPAGFPPYSTNNGVNKKRSKPQKGGQQGQDKKPKSLRPCSVLTLSAQLCA